MSKAYTLGGFFRMKDRKMRKKIALVIGGLVLVSTIGFARQDRPIITEDNPFPYQHYQLTRTVPDQYGFVTVTISDVQYYFPVEGAMTLAYNQVHRYGFRIHEINFIEKVGDVYYYDVVAVH